MYEIIMCSENWFETKSTSFILKTFWEHYITVWVETCSKTVWFLYIEKWLHRERHKLAWFMEWILNWDYRHQITFFILLFSFSITTLLVKIIWKISLTFTEFLKKFITLYRVFWFFAHECVIAEFDSHGINMSIVLDSLIPVHTCIFCQCLYVSDLFWSYEYSFHLIQITT